MKKLVLMCALLGVVYAQAAEDAKSGAEESKSAAEDSKSGAEGAMSGIEDAKSIAEKAKSIPWEWIWANLLGASKKDRDVRDYDYSSCGKAYPGKQCVEF